MTGGRGTGSNSGGLQGVRHHSAACGSISVAAARGPCQEPLTSLQMTYQLKRPMQTKGPGGLTVYRAMGFGVVSKRLWPQGYVANLQSFREL